MAKTIAPPALSFLKAALNRTGSGRLRVFGNSMTPTLREGDIVEVKRYPFHCLMPGQIIAFSRDEKIYMHRVRYKTSIGVLTAGDANILLDEPVKEEEYLGLVTARIRKDGSLEPLHHKMEQKTARMDPLLVFMPAWLYERLPKHVCSQTLAIRPFYETDSDWITTLSPERAVGISPYGLIDEREGFDLMAVPGLQYIVCMANFGPEGSGLFPINKLRGIIRFRIFDHLSDPYAPEAMLYFLGYLDGILSVLRKKGGESTC
jgi:signal peptidase I